MALIYTPLNCTNYYYQKPFIVSNPTYPNLKCNSSQSSVRFSNLRSLASTSTSTVRQSPRRCLCVVNNGSSDDDEENSLGVKAALSMLRFYKREISPLLPNSCRYQPTCSEYSMIAYKKYGVAKGTVLTAWRLCRCNPLGGSGFDPPRWFDETTSPEE